MVIIPNDYHVHSCQGLHLGSRIFKLEAFGALFGSLELCSVDCGEIVMLLALFVDAIVNLHPMDEKMFNGVLIGK
jgi:hypothetical protein